MQLLIIDEKLKLIYYFFTVVQKRTSAFQIQNISTAVHSETVHYRVKLFENVIGVQFFNGNRSSYKCPFGENHKCCYGTLVVVVSIKNVRRDWNRMEAWNQENVEVLVDH